MSLNRSFRTWHMAPVLALCAGLTGCISVPELDRADDPDFASAPYPALVPLGPALGGNTHPAADIAEEEAAMASRIAALRARAQQLTEQPVIDPATRTKLTEATAP